MLFFSTESTRSNSRDLMRNDEGCDGTFRMVRYNHGCRPEHHCVFSFDFEVRLIAFPGRHDVSDEPGSQLSPTRIN